MEIPHDQIFTGISITALSAEIATVAGDARNIRASLLPIRPREITVCS